MDLLPTINKAYAMVLSDAKQKGVYLGTGNQSYNDAALNVRVTADKRNNKDGGKHTKGYPSKFCTFCKATEHLRYGCFKIIGYPNWYKGPKDNPKPEIKHRT